jgi:hypothetical protein
MRPRELHEIVDASQHRATLRRAGDRDASPSAIARLISAATWRYSGVGSDGSIPGNGAFEAHQQLVSIRGTHVSLLWQQTNAG